MTRYVIGYDREQDEGQMITSKTNAPMRLFSFCSGAVKLNTNLRSGCLCATWTITSIAAKA